MKILPCAPMRLSFSSLCITLAFQILRKLRIFHFSMIHIFPTPFGRFWFWEKHPKPKRDFFQDACLPSRERGCKSLLPHQKISSFEILLHSLSSGLRHLLAMQETKVRFLPIAPRADRGIGSLAWLRTRSLRVRLPLGAPQPRGFSRVCFPSPIGRGCRFKHGSVRVRVSRKAPVARGVLPHFALLAQLVEAADLRSVMSEFKSLEEHQHHKSRENSSITGK